MPTHELVALSFLLVGGVVILVVGWFVGLAMLWKSRVWTRREKWIGTLVLPGGIAPAVALLAYVADQRSGAGAVELTLWIAAVVAVAAIPTATAVYLARRARRY